MAALRVPAFLRVSLNLLRVAIIATLLVAFRQWANVTTYRLYLDHRIDDPGLDGGATLRCRRWRVVPKIVMRDDRMSFRAAIGRDSTILATVSAAGRRRGTKSTYGRTVPTASRPEAT